MDNTRIQKIGFNNITEALLMRGLTEYHDNNTDLIILVRAIDSYIKLYANYGSYQCVFEIPVYYLKDIDNIQKVFADKGYKIDAMAGAFLISWDKERENV